MPFSERGRKELSKQKLNRVTLDRDPFQEENPGRYNGVTPAEQWITRMSHSFSGTTRDWKKLFTQMVFLGHILGPAPLKVPLRNFEKRFQNAS